MKTSFIEMLELPNFGNMAISTIKFESRDNFFDDVMDINYNVITFISKYLYFKPRAAIFADIIKIITIFIRTVFKDSKEVKIIGNVLKCNLHLYFLIQQNLLISNEKILMSAELKSCIK